MGHGSGTDESWRLSIWRGRPGRRSTERAMACLVSSPLALLCAIRTRPGRLMALLPPIPSLLWPLFGTLPPISAPAPPCAARLAGVHRLSVAHGVGHQQAGRDMGAEQVGVEEEEEAGCVQDGSP